MMYECLYTPVKVGKEEGDEREIRIWDLRVMMHECEYIDQTENIGMSVRVR